ncbi:hypothetical protein [Paenibacillus spongiae]|uniref:Uncharacterized protein n=1 Tax=Paenibacillus spongiae TaxID=2909671 RepID=A0ABY5SFJ7_9BACL|nr:hypothetical protein [Paenibacillus spongiae]UVI32747.1 hypothetical protein L1F29_13360 [Paenibacillus spongiae]
MIQVFFQLIDNQGTVREPDVKPYEFDEAAVQALMNSDEVFYPEITKLHDNGQRRIRKTAVIEHTVLDLMDGIPVLRVTLREKAPKNKVI